MELEEVYLATIWHTGTKYFKSTLQNHYRVAYSHLNERVINQLPNYDKIYTTYRDPIRVAASWANRGRFKKGKNLDTWREQWTRYEELLAFDPIILDFTKGRNQAGFVFPVNPVGSRGDSLGVHKAIDQGNYDRLYRFIPKESILYAYECCQKS